MYVYVFVESLMENPGNAKFPSPDETGRMLTSSVSTKALHNVTVTQHTAAVHFEFSLSCIASSKGTSSRHSTIILPFPPLNMPHLI